MAVNKVVYNNTTLIDITNSTVTANTLQSGYIAYGADGNQINGTLKFQTIYTGDAAPSSALGSNGDIYIQIV